LIESFEAIEASLTIDAHVAASEPAAAENEDKLTAISSEPVDSSGIGL